MGGKNHPVDPAVKNKWPGPGHYETHEKDNPVMKNGPKYAMGSEPRNKDPNARENMQKPGAGSYENKSNLLKRSAPSFGFGSSSRASLAKSDSPGPGFYKVPCKVVDVAMYSNAHGLAEHKFV